MHSSDRVGNSSHLADGGDLAKDDADEFGSSRESGRIVSRRDKFRLNAGPSRKELQWRQIASVLLKIKAPPARPTSGRITHVNTADFVSPALGIKHGDDRVRVLHTELDGSTYSEQQLKNYVDRCTGNVQFRPARSDTTGINPHQLEDKGSGRVGVKYCPERLNEIQLNELLDGISWPLDAIGDLGRMDPFEIWWENLPESVDPVRGSGYKAVASAELKKDEKSSQSPDKQDEVDNVTQGQCCSTGRGERKRIQVQNIASALNSFRLPAGSTVADFGCGSGALMLPLAAIFPDLSFVGIDFKQESIALLLERARKANLQNVIAFHERIENYSGAFDACVALHACGIATDLALLQALNRRAAYVMSPCCVGKLKIPIQQLLENSARHMQSQERLSNLSFPPKELFNHTRFMDSNQISKESMGPKLMFTGTENGLRHSQASPRTERTSGKELRDRVGLNLVYPRSRWLRSNVSENEFQVLARAADWSSYDHESSVSRLHSLCKILVEMDRNEASRELGYWTDLFSLSDENAGTVGVSHILVGKPG